MKMNSIACFALALAACQQPGNDTLNAVDNEVNENRAGNARIETLPPSEDAGAPKSDKSGATIPVQFQGRWGIGRADCTSTRGDAKGLLTIEDTRLIFYESRGTLDTVLGATATSFDARYSFTGEGQTWKRTERLTISDGKLQRRTDKEPDQEPPVNLTYQRCAA